MYDYEFMEIDSNDDGQADTWYAETDMNGDGIVDTTITAQDSNSTGRPDTIIIQSDTTGNGAIDTVMKSYDYDDDGKINSTTLYQDTTSDGTFDTVTKIYDSNEDGLMDKAHVYQDLTGNKHPDTARVYDFDPETGQLLFNPAYASTISGTYAQDLENFLPEITYPDHIDGDPVNSMQQWEYQGDTGRCALYAQKFVIEEFTDQYIDIEEFTGYAESRGWFDDEGGTTFLNMNKMLNEYGIENEMGFHKSIEDIQKCVDQGGKVIVALDCHEIWYGEDNNIFSPMSAANHAVEVIGIDRTDPNQPMVILNDSGSPRGKGEMIPLDVFEGAWEDGDCQMISCYPS